nr:hypothetical protein [Bacteroidota bacterium]
MNPAMPWSPSLDITFEDLTQHDHAWIRASVYAFIPEDYEDESPLLVVTFHHNGVVYKYRTLGIDPGNIRYGEWNNISMDYLTPEVRVPADNLKVYVWHRGKSGVFIDDLKVDAWEPVK